MVRELLSIQIGRNFFCPTWPEHKIPSFFLCWEAGIQTGKQVWNLLRIEHGLDENGEYVKEIDGNLLENVFSETQNGN